MCALEHIAATKLIPTSYELLTPDVRAARSKQPNRLGISGCENVTAVRDHRISVLTLVSGYVHFTTYATNALVMCDHLNYITAEKKSRKKSKKAESDKAAKKQQEVRAASLRTLINVIVYDTNMFHTYTGAAYDR